MTKYSVKPNKNIFTAFIGLTVSGYDLAESTCDKGILDLISKTKYDEDVINYFKQARTSTCKVNPYWPRAFLLSLACLFITEENPHVYTDFQKFLSHMDSLEQINPGEKNDELIHWMEKLPAMIDKIQANALIQDVWFKYVSLVEKKVDDYSLLCSQSFLLIRNLFEIADEDMLYLIIIPNYLQAAEATDLVIMEEEIYIITANPDKESIVHELLHYALDKELKNCEDLIKENMVLLEPVLDDMIRYQYAWDYDESSWLRVYKENFMRAATIWVTFHDSKAEAETNAKLHEDYGFIYVPAILEEFFTSWNGLRNFREFVGKCLKACFKRNIIIDSYRLGQNDGAKKR